MIALRPYQRKAVDAIFEYFARYAGNPLLVLPTASGKSIVQAAFIKEALERYPAERMLLVSHVRELLEQNAAKLVTMWPEAPIGLYSASLNRREHDKMITVAGIQSIYRRASEFGPISLVFIDECHLVPKSGHGMYRQFLNDLRCKNPKLKVVGMSATPYRLDSGLLHEGKEALFSDIAYEAEIQPLMNDQYLCQLVTVVGKSKAKLQNVPIHGGEYASKPLAVAMEADNLVPHTCNEIVALCQARKKWLIFCSGIEHAQHVCDSLNARNIITECVTGTTPSKERAEILKRFELGKTRAITNVNVLTTGFDAPDIDVIILLRPTMSPGLYYQMVGRGLRIHPSKTNTLILDFAGNICMHGPIDRIRIKPKVQGGGISTAPMRQCPECDALIFIGARACKSCGYEFIRDCVPRHGSKASDRAILAQHETPHECAVNSVLYSPYRKQDKPLCMRVDYKCGLRTYSEYICPEHGGYASRRARRWWERRSGTPMPATVVDCLAIAKSLQVPKIIHVTESGKFPKIIKYIF